MFPLTKLIFSFNFISALLKSAALHFQYSHKGWWQNYLSRMLRSLNLCQIVNCQFLAHIPSFHSVLWESVQNFMRTLANNSTKPVNAGVAHCLLFYINISPYCITTLDKQDIILSRGYYCFFHLHQHSHGNLTQMYLNSFSVRRPDDSKQTRCSASWKIHTFLFLFVFIASHMFNVAFWHVQCESVLKIQIHTRC